jgi:hypothetical protein
MKLVMNRNITVSSTSGHAVHFEKDKPMYVPPMIVAECMAKGAVPAEGEKLPEVEGTKKEQLPPPMGEDRKVIIEQVFSEMVAKNERGTFNANGIPKADFFRKQVDFPIDGAEIKTCWTEYKQTINELSE